MYRSFLKKNILHVEISSTYYYLSNITELDIFPEC